jgi:anti-sigma factor RsiW
MKIPNIVDLTCQEVTEIITDYMTDNLTVEDRACFEQHLHACTWCMTYLAQMRRTVSLVGQLESATEPLVDAKLSEVFRRWRQEKT